MWEFFLVFVAGIFVGILTGLLPALPVFTGPFLLYYFYNGLPLEHLLVFWLSVVSGSQFFGSVATITTRIPGEESSLIYIRDLSQIPYRDLNQLLYSTAQGSMLAGLLATAFLWLSVTWVNVADQPWLMGLPFQITVYSLAILGFFFVDRRFFWTVALILLGLLLGPRQNYALPQQWFDLQYWLEGYTFYMLILGTVVIPDIVYSYQTQSVTAQKFHAEPPTQRSWLTLLRSSLLGIGAGLVPGPSASLASVAAYKTSGPDVRQRIVAAETANNSSVIACAIPLLVLFLPINQNTLIMSNIMELKGITIFDAVFEQSFIHGLRVIDLTAIALIASILVFYVLSTHLIDLYVKFIVSLHHKMKLILIIIVSGLIAVDLYSNEITLTAYLLLLSAFTLLGLILKRQGVSPLPFLFAAILGDKLIWLYIQFFKIYI